MDTQWGAGIKHSKRVESHSRLRQNSVVDRATLMSALKMSQMPVKGETVGYIGPRARSRQ